MGTTAAGLGAQGAGMVANMYSANQSGKSAVYNVKREAALKKTQLLEDYRKTLATNMAQGAASGFTQSGNLSQINEANKLTLDSDVNEINRQANSQAKLAKLGAKGQMASIFASSVSNVALDYQNKKDAWDKIGNKDGAEFDYFSPSGTKADLGSLGKEK